MGSLVQLRKTRTPKPEWLKVRMPGGGRYEHVRRTLRELGLATVCEEASCPNIGECWGSGTATVMLMGDVCTRGCRFCDVSSGMPGPLDPLDHLLGEALLGRRNGASGALDLGARDAGLSGHRKRKCKESGHKSATPAFCFEIFFHAGPPVSPS